MLQPPESFAMLDKYTLQLSSWNSAFEKFMASRSRDLTSKEVRGAALLKILHTAAKIMATVRTDMSDMRAVSEGVDTKCMLEYLDDFQIIIDLSRPLIAATEEDVMKGKPALTFSSDLGLVGPLYYVCINCPVASMQKTAMGAVIAVSTTRGNGGTVFWSLR